MNAHSTQTPDEQPSIDTIQELIPSFPLENTQALVVENTPDADHVLIPTGITPSTSARYKVNVMAVEITAKTELGPVIDTESLFKRKITISRLEDLIHAETVIEKRTYSVDPNPDEHNSGTLHFDGASRGNPGNAATGFVLSTSTTTIRDGEALGERTNNAAEYRALLDGLRRALEENITDITIKGDSQLIVKQLTGEYDCNAANLRDLFESVHEELTEFNSWSIEHVPRDKNHEADSVANNVLDAS